MNGGINHWITDASNINLAWFRDLNIVLNGLRSDGTILQETQSRFTFSAVIAATPWLFQVNNAYRFLTDLSVSDTRIHERLSPTPGLGLSASLILNSDIVTFTALGGFEGNSKNYMRIVDPAELPSINVSTVLIVDLNTTTHTARMIDALTGAPVLATGNNSVAVVTVDNSGAAAGSRDEDALQNITGQIDIRSSVAPDIMSNELGALNFVKNGGTGTAAPITSAGGAVTEELLEFDASISPGAKTHDQTQPRSTSVRFYYRP
jgi:hypothetical protein